MNPLDFAKFLKEHIGIFAGVPDSLLKPLNSALSATLDTRDFYTCANEGQAVAFASAYNLATKKLGAVYMQNSGLGNAINPLLSLSDELVYKIPLVLFIGLRGGDNDEPQHKKQGLVTRGILDACGISNFILSNELDKAKEQCLVAFKECLEKSKIIAILIEKGTFETFKDNEAIEQDDSKLTREESISIVQDAFKNAKFVSTTGMISREHYELRELKGVGHENDFLVVGSMGFASSIAYILSCYTKEKIVCLDGDGAFLMHMGALSNFRDSSFIHIVFNNFAHDSVGGQSTNALNVNFVKIAESCGYKKAYRVRDSIELQQLLESIKNKNELIFIEVLVKKGARKDLGRPCEILKLKEAFCAKLAEL
ncbi:MAG: phosphonopyruvate decarboxylase [Helicobacteraceae bacterium]|nr:phosphonopyruvate decarboxylase [Helicobacteraceae bacterium]